MPLITLTSDYGTKDHFVAALKGQLYTANKDIIIVDINHEIDAFDVKSAAYVMKNGTSTFPKGSIHIASINNRDGNSRFLIVKRLERYYIVPDNGLITLMFEEEDFEAYAYERLPKMFSFAELHQSIGEIVKEIANDNLESISVKTTSYKVLNNIQAIVMDNLIRASIFYIDGFRNAITNVRKETFDKFTEGKNFLISFRGYKIDTISKHYNDVSEGEALALFNEAGYLEIAVNKSNAEGLLGLEFGQLVMVESFAKHNEF